ncbi:hypothetical protein NDU88_002132 [Pleurodeles waltl]|uniref:Uncharacterized protein n=1 Tax=Pleurodeles waltl TaxID=8319 RepID=A0AAV7R991_PLEWA|nr:hypothetical protein NDU88_002132 [Pleurodeles waltl]
MLTIFLLDQEKDDNPTAIKKKDGRESSKKIGKQRVPRLRPIDSTRIPSAVKSRKCDAFRDTYTNVKECTSLDTRYHGGGLMELADSDDARRGDNTKHELRSRGSWHRGRKLMRVEDHFRNLRNASGGSGAVGEQRAASGGTDRRKQSGVSSGIACDPKSSPN